MKSLAVFREAAAAVNRYLVLWGGAGGGKSFFAAQKLIQRCLRFPPHRFLIVRKVARTCRASTFALLLDILAREGIVRHVSVNRSEMRIEFPNGSSILHAGVDDSEKIKSIAGITGVWIEEATELSQEEFEQVDLRLRGETHDYKQVILTFNPISRRHWIKRDFFDETGDRDILAVHTTFEDNVWIDAEYVDVLSSLSDPARRAVYLDGDWGGLSERIIYSQWKTTRFWPDDLEDCCYGLDFGFNNPSALVRLGRTGDVIVADELLYVSHRTNTELIDEMKAVIPREDRRDRIYADPAEPARIAEIKTAGFICRPADKDVEKGIDTVQSYELLVTERSENLISELYDYAWVVDREGNILDKPHKKNDHACDALRYGVQSAWNREKAGRTINFANVNI